MYVRVRHGKGVLLVYESTASGWCGAGEMMGVVEIGVLMLLRVRILQCVDREEG